jgi:type II secretory pathway component PulM
LTEKELGENIQVLKDLATRLSKMASEVEAQRDSMQAKNRPYSAAYNMVLRSIEDAAVTANAMADVSRENMDHLAGGSLTSA